jgi:hypothetical protein
VSTSLHDFYLLVFVINTGEPRELLFYNRYGDSNVFLAMYNPDRTM